MRPIFDLTPEAGFLSLVYISQALEHVAAGQGCKVSRPMRMKHSLTVVNHTFGVKQHFQIHYATDTTTVALCSDSNPPDCDGGTLSRDISFPSPQAYWEGKEKRFIAFLCWQPQEYDPDFNLQIGIACTASSSGSFTDEVAGMTDRITFITYGREEYHND